jgi:hypothetical protein
MMSIMVPDTCWASNKICNKNSSVASSWHFISTCFTQNLQRKSKHTFCVQQLFSESFAVYIETMWENTVEPDMPQMTLWCTCIAYWITKATNTYSEYVIIFALLLQHRLHECTSILHYMYTGCLVKKHLHAWKHRWMCITNEIHFVPHREHSMLVWQCRGKHGYSKNHAEPDKCMVRTKYRTL